MTIEYDQLFKTKMQLFYFSVKGQALKISYSNKLIWLKKYLSIMKHHTHKYIYILNVWSLQQLNLGHIIFKSSNALTI